MSFNNTHTPTLAEIKGKARYQCPKSDGAFYMDDDTRDRFVKLYPITMNRDIMRIFGISFSVMQRFKRELGLEKNMRIIRHKQAQLAKQICEENGYYDSIRGKSVSSACKEALHKKFSEGFHPLRQLKKKNPAKYKRVMAKKAEARKELIRKEKIRVNWGMETHTNLHLPYDPFGKKRTSFRNSCKRAGYITGSPYDQSDRWIIYYDENTKRGDRREANGIKLGFTFVELTK